MDFYQQDEVFEPIAGDLDTALDTAANRLADSISGALSDALSDALADPLVRRLMAADRLDPRAVETSLRAMKARLGTCGGGFRLCPR